MTHLSNKHDYLNEFNLMMDLFNHPYKSKDANKFSQQVKFSEQSDFIDYDFSTYDGMKNFYLEFCCETSIEFEDRIESFIESIIQVPNCEMLNYISSAIASDLSYELEKIDGTINN